MLPAAPLLAAPFLAACRPLAAETATPDVATPDTEVLTEERTETDLDDPWTVTLFNDDIHTFDEVIRQLVKATGCTTGEADDMAWTVHTQGKCDVYEGTFAECFKVQGVLREIQLVTEIRG